MSSPEIAFVLSGQSQGGPRGAAGATPSRSVTGTVKASVRLAAQRGGGEALRVVAVPGEDVVVLHLAGGPSLVLHPETARDLLRGQGGVQRGAVARQRGCRGAGPAALARARAGGAHAWRRLPGRGAAVGLRGRHRPAQGPGGRLRREPGGAQGRRPGRCRRLRAESTDAGAAERQRQQAGPGARGERRRAAAGAGARHLRRHREHLRQAVGAAPAERAAAVPLLRRPRLRARPPDDRPEPVRQRAHARAGAARRRAAAPGDAFARRPGRRSAGPARRATPGR